MNQRDEWMVEAANRENAMQFQIGSTGAPDLSLDLCRTENDFGILSALQEFIVHASIARAVA